MLYDKERWEPKVKKLAGWQQVLLKAADLIDEKGWTKHTNHNEYGYCARGAIIESTWNPYYAIRAMFKLRAYLQQHGLGWLGGASVSSWNDHEFSRSYVTLTMRKAAE